MTLTTTSRDVGALLREERMALIDTLRSVGPDAPTLCAPWTATSIAAHLMVSESLQGVPLSAMFAMRRLVPGSVARRAVAAMRGTEERMISRRAQRGWDSLLHDLASGPPRLHRHGALAMIRFIEGWVHHEDVRRANGLPLRQPTPDVEACMLAAMETALTTPEFADPRHGLEVHLPDGTVRATTPNAPVRIIGPLAEVLLYVTGRTEHAHVEVQGEAAAVADLVARMRV